MMHRIQSVFQTIVGSVLALALLGVSATFGLAVLGIVVALMLVGLAVALVARVNAKLQSPQVGTPSSSLVCAS